MIKNNLIIYYHSYIPGEPEIICSRPKIIFFKEILMSIGWRGNGISSKINPFVSTVLALYIISCLHIIEINKEKRLDKK